MQRAIKSTAAAINTDSGMQAVSTTTHQHRKNTCSMLIHDENMTDQSSFVLVNGSVLDEIRQHRNNMLS